MPDRNLNTPRLGQFNQKRIICEAVHKRLIIDDGIDKTIERILRSAFACQNFAKSLDIGIGAGMRAIRHIANDEIVTDKFRILCGIIPLKAAKRADADSFVFKTARIFETRGIAIRI